MYDNIGRKLKFLSELFSIIGIFVCVISGFFLMLSDKFALGFEILVGGSLGSYIGFGIIHAIGVIAEKVELFFDKPTAKSKNEPITTELSSDELTESSSSLPIASNTKSNHEDHFWICPECGAHTPMKSFTCIACGHSLIS